MYVATVWVDDQAPALDATNLNKIEQGVVAVDVAVADIVSGAQSVGHATTATTATSLTVPVITSPLGAVIMWPSSTIPAGYLECNGATLPRTHALFAILGTVWGVGDGVTTFNIPDLRGQFVRGWDHGKGVDAGRSLGSAQADDVKAHTHTLATGTYSGGAAAAGGDIGVNKWLTNPGTTGSTGTETRPKNYSLIYLIKSGA